MQMYVLYVYEKSSLPVNFEPDSFIIPWDNRSLAEPPENAIFSVALINESIDEIYRFVEKDELFPGTELHLTEERFAHFLLRFS